MPTKPARARRWIKQGTVNPFFNKGVFCVLLNIEPSDSQLDDKERRCLHTLKDGEETAKILMITHAMEDYLKTVYLLQEGREKVSTSAIAQQMEVSAASVTGMIRKLAAMGFLNYASYHGVELTEGGKKIAQEIIRHHRLLELYLVEIMGFTWDKVHDEADKLEHVISEEFEERMSEALGHPTTDPHGHAIPAKDGALQEVTYETLTEVNVGSSATVQHVNDNNPEMLRYLDQLGLLPGTVVQVMAKEPFNGPLRLRIDQTEHFVGLEVAGNVFVSPQTTLSA